MSKKSKQLLGAHISTQGGVSKAVELASSLGFTAMQIFTKNNNRWSAKPTDQKEILRYKKLLEESDIKFVVSHASYLINLCSNKKDILSKSREAFIDELLRCEQLDIPHLNFHPGAHLGEGETEGIQLIADSLNYCHRKTPKCSVKSMIEMTAGQGTSLGHTIDQIRDIIELVDDKSRISVCIDTAHIFAAGYDIRDKKIFRKMLLEFDKKIGLHRLQCFHVNDSKKELGSKVDRHEHIGKGFIGLEGFSNLMNEKKLSRIPKILETPKGKEQLEDLENLSVLLSLVN